MKYYRVKGIKKPLTLKEMAQRLGLAEEWVKTEIVDMIKYSIVEEVEDVTMRDVWVVEYQNKAQEFEQEKDAADFQEGLAAQGISSQLYHEKHVLTKIPYRWLTGKEKIVEV